MDPLLEVQDLHVEYERDTGPVAVLTGASLTVQPGESVGVVGESGSGKTVLVRSILGLLDPPWRTIRGRVLFEGVDLLRQSEKDLRRVRGKEIALTTPEPRKHLDPVSPIGDQLANVILAHAKVSRKEAFRRAVELLAAVGIPDPGLRLRSYPHELSGGMCQRVIIAMGLAHSPKLLLADEPTAGLDVTISRQILDLMHDLVREFNSSLLLVSRDLGVVAHYCQRVAVMHAGQMVEVADVLEFFDHAAHPYSRRLLWASAAARDDRRREASTMRASQAIVADGCRYAPRCPIALEACRQQSPELEPLAPGHLVRCFRKHEVMAGKVAEA